MAEGTADYTTDGADGAGWDPALEDDSGAVMRAVGRMIKVWREAAGLKQAEFGAGIGYGEEMVSSVERGRRVPKPEFLDNADRLLGAGGKISAMKGEVAEARYPKKVRDVAKLEAEASELGAFASTVVDGLLQTESYARALFDLRRPTYSEDEIDRQVAARMARQEIYSRRPAPLLTFVQEEATLRRPIGGREVLRGQLEHLLEMGELRHVEIQVMPTAVEEHSGLGGSLRVLKLIDGTMVGLNEVQLTSRLISEPREAQILDMRYGMIRAQALTPRESMAFIAKIRDES
ncbi:helix-turn-helix domain-containing protein [Streptomyces sp. HNM0575]|uniref:helix-turn-helix domain-containing protein n=1 Tax=Streptomyces sp. HNM0575 TaxID=2716338 RepID=UPI00145F7FC6|nr:helix-turn-helix transcriptional regulator [Streptomyces sp. HNM0575]NLU76747.1 helix-turn-helix domain-containing protein [Streptomyces sp. HNM0575]